MGALEDAREAAAMPRGTRAADLTDVVVTARLVSIDSTRATVSVRGSQPVPLRYIGAAADYAGVTVVYVACNPSQGGRADTVLGPAGAPDVDTLEPLPPAPSGTVTATALVLPTWSGTWVGTPRNAWDLYNLATYGGRSDLYQGDPSWYYALTGLATYGDQIVNLGASSITSAVLTVQRNGSGGDAVVTVQGAPHASKPAGAPAPTGTTASSASLSATGKGTIALGSTIREDLRTGTAKSLALVGTTYAGVYGTSRADGMALFLTYTRPA